VTHALAADAGLGDFDATFVTNDTAVTDAFVFATVTFVIFGRSKDALTEQTIFFWFESSVVDGFWLCNFTKRPTSDSVRRGD
jgi:hypothetical protein